MKLKRASGILLHPTSLPGRYGIGDLGPEARRFVDWLAAGRQRWWEVLPLGPTGCVNSPFSAHSTFAGNPLLLSPEELVRDGLLAKSDIVRVPRFPERKVNFASVEKWKMRLLRKAHRNFRRKNNHAFTNFVSRTPWLNDFALYMALKARFNGKSWVRWPRAVRIRARGALEHFAQELAEGIAFHQFLQWQFALQWKRLREYAHDRNIRMIGNLAFYPAHDSAEVWANQHLFHIDRRTGKARSVAGVPPDYFSKRGQLWGNPTYRWNRIRREKWRFVLDRLRATLAFVDIMKLDHFRGYVGFWEIPAHHKTAKRGRWKKGPGRALFAAIQQNLGTLPLLVEDLGKITEDVNRLRKDLHLPGLRILLFGLDSTDRRSYHFPEQYPTNSVAYTGTHDNNTVRGWYAERHRKNSTRPKPAMRRAREFARAYLRTDAAHLTDAALKAVWDSRATLALAPLQDILGLGAAARMNTPGKVRGNWSWRTTSEALSVQVRNRLRELTKNARR